MPEAKGEPPGSPAVPKMPAESNRLGKIKDVFGIVQSVVTIVAILSAAIWFYVHREHLPKANITHDVTHRQLTDDITWVQVSIKITNVGKRLLDLKSGVIRVQQILPLDPLIADKLQKGENPVSPQELIIAWPRLGDSYRPELRLHIEPGETDILEYDFLIPAYVRTVKIYSHFERLKEPPIGWAKTTIYDLKKQGG